MRVKTFIYALKNSLTQTKYYLDILQAPLNFSLRFFFISFLILSLFAAIKFNYADLPKIKQNLLSTINDLQHYYPENLLIKYDNQTLGLYQQEANQESQLKLLEIDYPNYINREQLNLPKKLLTFSQEADPNNLQQNLPNSTFILATPKKFYLNSQNSWQEFSYENYPGFEQNFLINKQNLADYSQAWIKIIEETSTLLKYLIFILLPIFLILSRLWIVAIDGLFIYLFLKIGGSKLSIKNVFAWSLHIMVIAELVNQISKTLYQNLTLPMFTLTFWGIFLYLSLVLRKQINQTITYDKK